MIQKIYAKFMYAKINQIKPKKKTVLQNLCKSTLPSLTRTVT